jgi:hypothetical protein
LLLPIVHLFGHNHLDAAPWHRGRLHLRRQPHELAFDPRTSALLGKRTLDVRPRMTNPAMFSRMTARASVMLLALATCAVAAGGCGETAAKGGASTAPARQPSHLPKPKPSGSRHHAQPTPAKHARGIPAADEPNRALSPGVAIPGVTATQICVSGYAASVRDVPESEKHAVYARYHTADVPDAHEVDHLVSLELGGSNGLRNLWPEPYAGRWGARTKDQLENTLHDLVCNRTLSLRFAQHIEATNWVAAYRRYVSPVPLATPGSPDGGGSSTAGPGAGGYYASSYPTARTIYCADDPEWRALSPHYLVRFATRAAAFRRFPGRHLHQPC